MKNIVLLGAGNIGSRHLQAMRILDPLKYKITVYDAFSDFSLCKQRIKESGIKAVIYTNDMKDIPKNIFFLIIATTADVRFQLYKDVITSRTVKYCLLEKVLFQSLEHYQLAIDLSKKYFVKTWVNSPVRLFKNLKDVLQKNHLVKNINMNVIGNNWGLACNFIHYLEMLAKTLGCYSVFIQSYNMACISSKRAGFIDFVGHIKGSIGERGTFSLTSFDNDFNGFVVSMVSDLMHISYYPITGETHVKYFSDQKTDSFFAMEYQSNLTGEWIANIEHTYPELSTLEQSTCIHLPFIKIFLKEYNNNNSENSTCPIT